MEKKVYREAHKLFESAGEKKLSIKYLLLIDY